jgi:hypothetical protein
MISYYFLENEIGRAKWHSYSYWSCFQQWFYWKNYWLGYHHLCNKYHWNLKWQWGLSYELETEMRTESSTSLAWSSETLVWSLESKEKLESWWVMWFFLSGVALRVGNLSMMNPVVLPVSQHVTTLLKSPHADKKSREQFSRKKWSLVWKMFYGSPNWNMGYVTSTSSLHM